MRKTEGRHRDSNPEPSDHMSSTLTIAPPRHDRYGRLDSAPKYSVTLARMRHYNRRFSQPRPGRLRCGGRLETGCSGYQERVAPESVVGAVLGPVAGPQGRRINAPSPPLGSGIIGVIYRIR